jgi:hypothetical protein
MRRRRSRRRSLLQAALITATAVVAAAAVVRAGRRLAAGDSPAGTLPVRGGDGAETTIPAAPLGASPLLTRSAD